MGFNVMKHEHISNPSIHNMNQTIEQWTDLVTHNQCPFPMDGLVVTFDDTTLVVTGSIADHHTIRAELVFKWEGEVATTELECTEWPYIAPTISLIAVFKPVELEGTTVKKASLYNISGCEGLGIGGPGSILSVIKANKIIPEVIKIVQTAGALEIPYERPVCHHQTRTSISKASGTRTLHCINKVCPAKQLRKFNRFVSENGTDVDGTSRQTLARFINLGWLNTYTDIYRLPNYVQQIALLGGFGNKSAGNMMRSIGKLRIVEAHKFLYTLTIPMCGIDTCKHLPDVCSLHELINKAVKVGTPKAFVNIPGIGPETSAPAVKWFQVEANRNMVDDLLKTLNTEQPSTQPTDTKCEGLTFVITGDIHRYKNRTGLRTYIENQGGHMTGSVSKSTNYLISNNVNSTSEKNKEAKELGIEVISEDQPREQSA